MTGYGCRQDVVRPSCSLGTEQRFRTRNDECGRSTKRPGLGRRGRVLNEGAATQPVVDAVPEPSNRYVRSTRRQSDHAVAEQCRCRSSLTLSLLRRCSALGDSFPLKFLLLLSKLLFSHSAQVLHRFTVPLCQTAP